MVWKENSLGHVSDKWEVFLFLFSDYVTQYIVDVFSEPPTSLLTNKFRNASIFHKKVSKLIDKMCLFIKLYGIKGLLFKSGFTELASFFSLGFCNIFLHLQGVF